MDSMTIIAVVSIITAGLTIALGSIGPALGEGRAVSTALSFAGATTRRLGDDHPHFVRGPGHDRIHCDLLLRGLDDSDFRQPVLEPRHRRRGQSGGKINLCCSTGSPSVRRR